MPYLSSPLLSLTKIQLAKRVEFKTLIRYRGIKLNPEKEPSNDD
jgi:hypothetical protein